MQSSAGKKNLLIIEDEEILLEILTKKFTSLGYEVESATDGETGFALIKKLKPNLVLLDMMLPKMDGFHILDALAKEEILPRQAILIISNSGQPVEIDRAMKLGVKDYIVKVNFDPDEVVAKVKEILENGDMPGTDMAATEKPNKKAPKTSANVVSENTRILLVEDDLFILQLLNDKLHRANITTFVASDAETALDILKKKSVELLLLDIVLPGMDGFTFLQQLKADEQFKNIPVIFLSNLGQREEVERGLKLGALDYIIKANNSPSEILDRIQKVLEDQKKKKT